MARHVVFKPYRKNSKTFVHRSSSPRHGRHSPQRRSIRELPRIHSSRDRREGTHDPVPGEAYRQVKVKDAIGDVAEREPKKAGNELAEAKDAMDSGGSQDLNTHSMAKSQVAGPVEKIGCWAMLHTRLPFSLVPARMNILRIDTIVDIDL